MQLIKRLTQTLSAGSTSLTFTDSMINNNSIIEVYADSIEVYPTALSQSGTSVTVQFDEQQAAHSILLLINNIVSLSDPTLATLLDVDLSTLSEDDILTYDGTAEKWVNAGARTAEDISYDNTDSGLTATDVQAAIDEVFQYVSDGKELIADAITDKGVPTSATDTFAIMASNISNIPTDTGSKVKMLDLDSDSTSRLVGFTTPQVQWRNTAGYSTVMFDLGELKSIKWLAVLFQGDAKPDMWRVTTRQDTSLTENQYNDNYMSDDYNKNVLAHTQAFTNLRASNPFSIRRVFVCIGWYDQTLDYWKQHAKIQVLYEEAEEV